MSIRISKFEAWRPAHLFQAGWLTLLLVFATSFRGVAEDADPTSARIEIRFAFAKSMFSDVNESDTRAAMKVYAQTIGDQNGIYVSSAPELLDGTNAITETLKLNRAEMFTLTTEEFLALESLGLEGPLLMSSIRQRIFEEYLLLSRADSSLARAEDLKGRSLIVCGDMRCCLAPLWLEVLSREHGLGPAERALAKITTFPKVIQVVLPVFFGKADACIVTRNGFEVMCELNPQLQKQLRIVAVSPPVVPALTCFRGSLSEKVRQRVIKAVELSSTKPTYKQLMALFKSDGVGYQPLTALDSARELVAQYRQLCAGVNLTKSVAPAPNSPHGEIEREGK